MREDPIVFQDWDIGLLLPRIHSQYSAFNLFLSLFIALISGGLGFYFRLDFLFLLSVFYAIISLLAEGLMIRIEASSLSRASFYVITLFFGVLTLDSLFSVTLPNTKRIFVSIFILVVTFLIALKGMILLINEQLGRMIGQVLIPKNENSRKKLDEQIKLFKNTEFCFPTPHETKKTTVQLLKYYLRYFVLGFLITIPLIIGGVTNSEVMFGSNLGILRIAIGIGISILIFLFLFVPISFSILFLVDKAKDFWSRLVKRFRSLGNSKMKHKDQPYSEDSSVSPQNLLPR